MELLEIFGERLRRLGAQRRESEIALAVLLTVAAAIFIAVAVVGRGVAPQIENPADAPYTTARQPVAK